MTPFVSLSLYGHPQRKIYGAPGWFSQLNGQLLILVRSWSHSHDTEPFVGFHAGAWSLLKILSLPLPFPHSLTCHALSLRKKKKKIKSKLAVSTSSLPIHSLGSFGSDFHILNPMGTSPVVLLTLVGLPTYQHNISLLCSIWKREKANRKT